MRTGYKACDDSSAYSLMSAQYAAMKTPATPQKLYLRLELEEIGRARLDRMVYRLTTPSDADPLGVVCVALLRDGRLTYRPGRTELPCTPGDVVYVADPKQPLSVTWTDTDIDFVILQPGLFDDVATTDGAGPVTLLSHRPRSPTAAQSYRRLVRALRAARADEFDGTDAPLVAAAAARLLAAATLATFPNNARTDPTATDRRDARPLALRRAMAFVESDPRQDMTIADIAAAAGVTPRAIQLAFRRYAQTTPTGYVRRVRLAHAHEELRTADPAHTTVSAVAHRWGFGNSSRFAARYREQFGESPGQTLRR